MKETIVGFLFFLFIGILLYFTVAVKGVALVSTGDVYEFDVLFKNAKYLKRGHPVVFAGQQVGTVQDIWFDEEKNRVRVRIQVVGVRIPRNAKIQIVSSTLFGGRAVSISRPDVWSGEFYESGGTYEGHDTKELLENLSEISEKLNVLLSDIQDNLAQTVENAKEATEHLKQAVEKINRGKGVIGRLVNDDQMGENLAKMAQHLEQITESLAEGKGALGRLLVDRELGDRTSQILKHVEEITGKIASGEGTLGKLIQDSQVYQNLARLTEKVDQLVGNVLQGKGTFGKLFTEDTLYDHLVEISGNIRTITGDIVEQRGLVGRAIRDEKLGEDFAEIIANLREATESIKNIAEKIDSGKGSLGNLINSDELVLSAKEALDNLNATLGRAARTETIVGLGYFFFDEQELTAYKGYIQIIPSKTKFFHLGVTLFSPSDKSPIDFDRQKKKDGKLFIFPDVLVGKRFHFFEDDESPWNDVSLTVRLGLLEGQVGGGIDIDFLKNLRLTLEARTPHKDKGEFNENINRYMARAFFSARFLHYFRGYIGIDNFIENAAISFGITTDWYDEDVRSVVALVATAR